MKPHEANAGAAQAWVELRTEDPEAVSALAVARVHLSAGRSLTSLRRLRVFELKGRLPDRKSLEDLLHRSIQFYNPHMERCTVRTAARESAPVGESEQVVLVVERGGARRPSAERWWLHETGEKIEVREGVAWALAFAPGEPAAALAAELAEVRDRRHGLLCNPHSQKCRIAAADLPFPWQNFGNEESATGGEV